MQRSKISNYLLDKHLLHPLSNVSAKIPRTDAQREFIFSSKCFLFLRSAFFSLCGGAMSIVVHNFIKIHVYLLNRKILITYIYFRQVYHYASKVLYHYSSCKHLVEKMNKTEGFFFTVKYVMYRSNKIRAKKAFIFIEKYMHSNGAGRKEATEMRELCLQRCLILGILHQSKHYIVPMSYF